MATACVFFSFLTGLYLQDWETKGLIPAAAHCWHQPPCEKVGSASPLDYISSGGVFYPGSHPIYTSPTQCFTRLASVKTTTLWLSGQWRENSWHTERRNLRAAIVLSRVTLCFDKMGVRDNERKRKIKKHHLLLRHRMGGGGFYLKELLLLNIIIIIINSNKNNNPCNVTSLNVSWDKLQTPTTVCRAKWRWNGWIKYEE